MIELVADVLYWAINILIVLAGVKYAIKIWDDKIRTLKGVSLFLGGILWHVFRAIYNFSNDLCQNLNDVDSLIITANKCISSESIDIIWAQIAIFIGLFIIIAEIYGRYRNNLFAGIDLGTSGCRIVVIDYDKKVQHSFSISYADNEKQTPALWWDSVSALLKELPSEIKTNLQALAIDGTSGSILLTDSQGNPSSSALMYNDLRATDEAKKIKQILPQENGGQGASGSLARLLWLLKHEPDSKHAHALHQADFILGKLSNTFNLSDENNCLKLGYDVVNQRWPEAELNQLGVTSSLLPKVFPAGTSVSTIDKNQAERLGLSQSLKLITGTTDSVAAFVATGAENIGDAVTSLGSTLVLKLISDKPIFSSQHGIYSHRLNNHWLVGGASNSGAKVLQHYFSQREIDELTTQLSSNKNNKPTGLDYYPLIEAGERFPVADATKPPMLSPRPDSDSQFFQGILEGIANIEQQGYQKLVELGATTVSSVMSVGGGSKNKAWTLIRKNRLKVDMITPEYTEAAYGSALLALKGYQRGDKTKNH